MMVSIVILFSVALVFMNIACIPTAIAGHIEPSSTTELIFYPFYGMSALTLIFSMGFTFVSMLVINLSYYCKFGVMSSSQMYTQEGAPKLGSFLACIISS
jgi:hypothetical protein